MITRDDLIRDCAILDEIHSEWMQWIQARTDAELAQWANWQEVWEAWSMHEDYLAANRVFDHEGSKDDIAQTEKAGLIIWEVDIDGYAPSPTKKYLKLMDKFDPTPEEIGD